MLFYALRRLFWSIPVILIASVLVFVAVKSSTDPAGSLRSPGIRSSDIVRFRQQLHLDDSWFSQYWAWFTHFIRGDLGHSLNNKAVWPDPRDAMIITVQLGVLSYNIHIGLGLTICIISAIRQPSWFDSLATGISFFGLSIP